MALGSDFDGCVLPRDIGDVTGLSRLMEELDGRGFKYTGTGEDRLENWISALEKAAG